MKLNYGIIEELTSYADQKLVALPDIKSIVIDFINRTAINPGNFDIAHLRSYLIDNHLQIPEEDAPKEEYIRIIKWRIEPTLSSSIDISPLRDDLLGAVFQKLRANDIYRLYQLSNRIRRIVDQQVFWKRKLEIEGYQPPQFPVDWREWYLTINDYPIAGRVYLRDSSQPIRDDIIKMTGNIILDRRGRLHKILDSIGRCQLLGDLPVMKQSLYHDLENWVWIGLDGGLNIKGSLKDRSSPNDPKHIVWGLHHRRLLFLQTESGELYHFSLLDGTVNKSRTDLVRIFIDIDLSAIIQTVDGSYHRFDPTIGSYQLLPEAPRSISTIIRDAEGMIVDGTRERRFRIIPFALNK